MKIGMEKHYGHMNASTHEPNRSILSSDYKSKNLHIEIISVPLCKSSPMSLEDSSTKLIQKMKNAKIKRKTAIRR